MTKIYQEIHLVYEKFSELSVDRTKSYQRLKRINKENGKVVIELID